MGSQKPVGPKGTLRLWAIPGGRWEERARSGVIPWFGPRKLEDYNSKGGGMGLGEEGQP